MSLIKLPTFHFSRGGGGGAIRAQFKNFYPPPPPPPPPGGGGGGGGITGPNLELLSTSQSDAAPIWENYAKLYFDAKHW